MYYDCVFAQIGDIEESDQSVNPIFTPTVSSNITMVDDDRSNNKNNELGRLPPLCGHLGNKNDEKELDRPRPLKEGLAPERTLAPFCIHNPPHLGTFHFRNGMIVVLPQFHGMENEKAYLHLRKFDEVCETFLD